MPLTTPRGGMRRTDHGGAVGQGARHTEPTARGGRSGGPGPAPQADSRTTSRVRRITWRQATSGRPISSRSNRTMVRPISSIG